MNTQLQNHLISVLPGKPQKASFTRVGGGSINETWQIDAGNEKFFCKINSATAYPGLFEKEASGLQALRDTGCIRTPSVIGTYYYNTHQVLLLEWVESGPRTIEFWRKFGQQLASLHQWKDSSNPEPHCGFHEDNYMGALPQQNTPTRDWSEFFREKRLKPQVSLALQKQLLPPALLKAFDNLYEKLPQIFPPEPVSMLHGDLWSGNFLCNQQGEPVLIDPAVYYGHRSMDLAMTTLFGGYNRQFYDAYAWWYSLPAGYTDQWEICNLYPLLIHLNLFGKSYLPSIEGCLRRFGYIVA